MKNERKQPMTTERRIIIFFQFYVILIWTRPKINTKNKNYSLDGTRVNTLLIEVVCPPFTVILNDSIT